MDSNVPNIQNEIMDQDDYEDQQKLRDIKQRKRRRFFNSFFCSENLVQWNESNKGNKVVDKLHPSSIQWFKSVQ